MKIKFTRFLIILSCAVLLFGILPNFEYGVLAEALEDSSEASTVTSEILDYEDSSENNHSSIQQNSLSLNSLARSTGACYINHLAAMVTNNADVSISWTGNDGVYRSTTIRDLAWHYVDDARNPGYCLEPNKSAGYGYGTLEDVTIDTLGSGSVGANVWDSLSETQREAIALILLYGLPNNYWDSSCDLDGSYNNTNRGYFAAGQVLVWEIITGLRNSTWPYAYANVSNPKKLYNAFNYGSSVFANGYAALVEDLKNHLVIPSFCSRYKNSAPTITLKPDGTGWYTATVKDANKILSKFNFSDSTGNVIFTRSGNTLTIKAKSLPSDPTFAAAKTVPSSGKSSYFLAYSSNSKQTMLVVNEGTATDPVPAYFKLDMPTGDIAGTKTTDTGEDLAGWEFQLKSGDTIVSTATSDDSGSFSFPDILPGEYTLAEIIPEDSLYECAANNQSITVTAGETSTVNVHNQLKTGSISVSKTTNTGKNLGGWKFDLYDANKNYLDTYSLPDSGELTISGLTPGKYYLTEQDKEDPYWECDTEEKVVEVTAGTSAAVSFHNTHFGELKINKSLRSDGELSGWEFQVTDSDGEIISGSPFTTDKDGTIKIEGLLPGEYTVEELSVDGSLYVCESDNPQIVTVKAGQSTTASFVNALRPGRIELKKVNSSGASLAGAKFLLEWSDDGETWSVVTLNDSAYVVKGACFSEGLNEGCLTTDDSGVIVFENLHPDLQYRITELESPNGYILLSDYAFIGKLPTDTLELSLSVVNTPGYMLPSTGIADSYTPVTISIAIGFLICSLCLLLLFQAIQIQRGKDLGNHEEV